MLSVCVSVREMRQNVGRNWSCRCWGYCFLAEIIRACQLNMRIPHLFFEQRETLSSCKPRYFVHTQIFKWHRASKRAASRCGNWCDVHCIFVKICRRDSRAPVAPLRWDLTTIAAFWVGTRTTIKVFFSAFTELKALFSVHCVWIALLISCAGVFKFDAIMVGVATFKVPWI